MLSISALGASSFIFRACLFLFCWQFFITLAPNIDYLDSQNHTVFGEVAEGFDVLNTLNEAIVDVKNMPYKDIRIFHTVVLDDPFEDPPGLESYIPDRSPSPTPEKFKVRACLAEAGFSKCCLD